MLMQFRVFHVAQTFTRDDDDVPAGQDFLVQTKRVTHQTFQAVALNGELYAFFTDDQPQSGVFKAVLTRKEQQVLPWHLAGWGVKDCFEMPGCQQTLFPTVVLTHHQCRRVKLPDACGPWRDDATGRYGRSW